MIISKFLIDFIHGCIDEKIQQKIMYGYDKKLKIVYYFQFDYVIIGDDFSVAMEFNQIDKEGFIMQLPADSKEYAVHLVAQFCTYIPSDEIEVIDEDEFNKLYHIWECSIK